jgi:hypothetical protein
VGAGPIEDSLLASKNETKAIPGLPPLAGNEGNGASDAHFGHEGQPMDVPALSPPEAYIRAQHLFIEAQQLYIHKPNVQVLAAEQEAYIHAQTAYVAYLLTQH